MAIDPLQPKAIRHTLTAALELKDRETAVQMLQALLELEPADAARTHFQLAQILMADNTADAKRHVLLALEQAPRYRDAHKLLLQLQHSDEAADVRE
jgi:tetratricopeptide (TPR) repeat protein